MKSYRTNYLKIYFWQSISILLGFASLFIVVPFLSGNKTLYGIYSVCTSLTIFFSYADLGFLSSGAKFAAEYYIKGDRENEMKVIGFTAFIMIVVFLLLDIFIIVLGFNPRILIPELEYGSENFFVARKLLFILALGCPAMIGQRIMGILFTIRVEDYKYLRFQIIASLCRILSVLYFFTDGRYMIVEYYAFFQIIYLCVVVAAIIYSRRYGYRVRDFIKTFKFDKSIFDREKALSGASLVGIAAMVLYNELDQVAISNFFGIEAVAIYAAAFSIMTLVRTFNSLIFAPYTSRCNHYAGLNDYSGLSAFVNKLILLSAPILVIPIFNLSLYTKPFVISWLGEDYVESAFIMSFLVLSYMVNFIVVPLSNYLIASEQNKNIVKTSLFTPIIFWIGILIMGGILQVRAFAIMKFIAPSIVMLYYWYVCKRDFERRGLDFVRFSQILKGIVVPIAASIVLSLLFKPIMFYTHDKKSLLLNIVYMGVSVVVSMVLAIFTNNELNKLAKSFIPKRIR